MSRAAGPSDPLPVVALPPTPKVFSLNGREPPKVESTETPTPAAAGSAETDKPPTLLTTEQRRRVEALNRARNVLRSGLVSPNPGAVLTLASFILGDLAGGSPPEGDDAESANEPPTPRALVLDGNGKVWMRYGVDRRGPWALLGDLIAMRPEVISRAHWSGLPGPVRVLHDPALHQVG